MLISHSKEDEMWIFVDFKGIRFGGLEFSLLTGLRFGQFSEFDINSLRIRDKYYTRENKICNDQL